MSVKIGLISPILTQLPAKAGAWERVAGPDELVAVARAADRLGFELMTCSEHIAVREDLPSWSGGTRGTVFWDPLATFGFLAAHTSGLRFATYTLILGLHHPLEIVKRYGTLDQVTGGRVVLCTGIGSYRDEFELLGASYRDRALRADDALQALRAALAEAKPSYDGPYYRFSDVVVEPHARQPHLPIWVGGHSVQSLRRALAYGDGWSPQSGLPLADIAGLMAEAHPPAGFELVLSIYEPQDPLAKPDAVRGEIERRREIGATTVLLGLRAGSHAAYLDQMAALAQCAGLTARA
jgi:probable F420-dependent oxidoreductase